MRLTEVIRKDVISKFTGEVLSRIAFLLFFFYAGRKLGTSDFGTVNLAISVPYILGVLFLDPGLNLSVIHMLVAHPDRRAQIASSIFSFKVLLFVPFVLVLGTMSVVFGGRLPATSLLVLGALYAFFNALFEYLSSLTNAYHRMDLEAYFKILNRFLMVALGFVALTFGRTEALLGSMAIATLLAAITAWFILRSRLVSVNFCWQFPEIRESLRTGLPVAGTLIVMAVYLKWDLLVLSYFNISREQLGWYAGSFKIVEAFSALPGILGAALYPMIITLRRQNSIHLERLLGITTKGMLLFSIPIAGAISLTSRQIISTVYGSQYAPGASVLAVLIWCIVPIFLYFFLVYANIAIGHANHNLLSGGAALIVGLVLNILLVPRIGYVGAAWAAVGANSTFAVFALWKVWILFSEAGFPRTILRFTAAGALMVFIFRYMPGTLWIQLSVGLFAYLSLLIVLGVLNRHEISLARRFFTFNRAHPSIEAQVGKGLA